MSLSTALATIEADVGIIVKKAEAEAETWFNGFAPVAEADVAAAWAQFKPVIMGLIVAVEQVAVQAIASGTSFNKLGAAASGLIAAAASQGISIDKAVATTVIQQAVSSIVPAGTVALQPATPAKTS